MYEKKENKRHIDVLKFKKTDLPVPKESLNVPDDAMVKYGVDNLYPNFLLKLYGESPIHASIINAKSTYIIGDGVKFKGGKKVDVMMNPSETFTDFIGKVVKDYLIFNWFAIEVVYNALKEPIQYYFVPGHKIRTNKLKTKFWFDDDFKGGKSTIVYDRWKKNNSDTTSKLFFFDGYFPSQSTVYPMPEYNGSIKSILTDIAIRDFNLNNIKNHFSVSTLITFFNGSNIQEDVKRQIVRDLEETFTGENGKKMIVDFQNANSKPTSVQNLSPNDWDKAYVETNKNVAEDIYRGHQVTSPMLFGVKTEGQLGGSTELETAYEIFKNTYIRGKRNELIAALNLLFSNSTLITSELEFTDKPLFNTGLSETLKEKVYTINELRNEAGLPPLETGNRLLSESAQPEQPPAPTRTLDEPVAGEVKKNSDTILKKLSEEDFEKVVHLGSLKDEFEIVKQGRYVFSKEDAEQVQFEFDLEKDVADWMLSNEVTGMSLDEIVSKLKDANIEISTDELKTTIKSLADSGLLKIDIKGDRITVNKTQSKLPESDKVFVMYDYVKRASADGADILPTSRSFCKKLIGNNKFYSMEDIQSMSSIFGYNVFQYGGGYWHNPSTDETTSHCRHRFSSVIVKRKATN